MCPCLTKDGASTSLKSYRGKLVYIDFWASWCGNCIIWFPYAAQLRNRLAVLGLDTLIRFVNINVDDTPKRRRQAMKKYHPEGTNLYSGDTSIFTTWNISAIPRYILLDTSGKILAKEMASPDDGSVDYVLYAASKGVHPVQALWKQFEQNKLMEKYKTSNAFTDKDYLNWFNMTIQSFIEFQEWRQHQQRLPNSRQQMHSKQR